MDTDAAPVASDPPPSAARRRGWAVFQVVLGLTLVGWLIGRLELGELVALARAGNPVDLAIGLALMFSAFPVLQALRMHVLVARYTERLTTTTAIYLIGALFNNVLPSNVGGDAAKLFYLQRLKSSGWGGPLTLLLLHRLSGVLLLHAAALVCIALRYEAIVGAFDGAELIPRGSIGTVLAILGAGVGAVGMLAAAAPRMRRRARRLLGRLWEESRIAVHETDAKALGWLVVLTLALHAARAAGFVFLLAFVGQSAHPLDLVIAMAVTAVAAMLPLTVGGLGVMEGALGMMLVAFGVSEPAAITVALAHRAVLLANAAAGGLVYAAYGRPTKR